MPAVERKTGGKGGEAEGDDRDGPRGIVEPLAMRGNQQQRGPGIHHARRCRRWLNTAMVSAAPRNTQSHRAEYSSVLTR